MFLRAILGADPRQEVSQVSDKHFSRTGKRQPKEQEKHSNVPAREKAILDAVTDKVLSYRPVDKGLAAKKTKRKLARKAKRDD